jgi:uncharacterized membrane protein
MRRLRPGELLAAAGGVALLALLWAPWYEAGAEVQFGTGRIEVASDLSAWTAFDVADVFLAVTALLAIATAVLQATRRSPALPVAASVLTATLGVLATLVVLFRLIVVPEDGLDRSYGVFAGFVSALALTAGGWLSMREE